jgi:hypothetical protein
MFGENRVTSGWYTDGISADTSSRPEWLRRSLLNPSETNGQATGLSLPVSWHWTEGGIDKDGILTAQVVTTSRVSP